jgi:hypothetical protein
MVMAMTNEAYSVTDGSTPAMKAKARASGISARATTVPARRSRRGLASHCSRIEARNVMRVCLYSNGGVLGAVQVSRGIGARGSHPTSPDPLCAPLMQHLTASGKLTRAQTRHGRAEPSTAGSCRAAGIWL